MLNSSGGVGECNALCCLCLLYMYTCMFLEFLFCDETCVSRICLFTARVMKFHRVSLWDVILSHCDLFIL